MFKYKWDAFQKITVLLYFVYAICLLALPYEKISGDGEIIKYGYSSFLNLCLIVYGARLGWHLFGFELFNFKAHSMAFGILNVASLYTKILMGRRELHEVMWSGVVTPAIICILLLGILFLDRVYYVIERR